MTVLIDFIPFAYQSVSLVAVTDPSQATSLENMTSPYNVWHGGGIIPHDRCPDSSAAMCLLDTPR